MAAAYSHANLDWDAIDQAFHQNKDVSEEYTRLLDEIGNGTRVAGSNLGITLFMDDTKKDLKRIIGSLVLSGVLFVTDQESTLDIREYILPGHPEGAVGGTLEKEALKVPLSENRPMYTPRSTRGLTPAQKWRESYYPDDTGSSNFIQCIMDCHMNWSTQYSSIWAYLFSELVGLKHGYGCPIALKPLHASLDEKYKTLTTTKDKDILTEAKDSIISRALIVAWDVIHI